MDFLILQFLDGLANASFLFLAAAGLSLAFATRRLVNFAQGGLVMLGFILAQLLAPRIGGWGALGVATLAVAAAGAALDFALLRRLGRRPELIQVLAVLAVGLMLREGLTPPANCHCSVEVSLAGLDGGIGVFKQGYPYRDLLVSLVGGLAAAGMIRHGRKLLAKPALLVMAVAGGLAGLAGALQTIQSSSHTLTSLDPLTAVLAVWVIGGLDSLAGTAIAALVVGVFAAFAADWAEGIGDLVIYSAMAMVLILRPHGLRGSDLTLPPPEPSTHSALTASHPFTQLMLGVLAVLTVVPLMASPGLMNAIGIVLIFALFSASLLLVTGLGGMTSLGHAAWFATGAYAVALGNPFIGLLASIFLAPLTAFLGAVGLARFGTYRQGIHLALLTLAGGEQIHAVARWIGPLVVTRPDWAMGPGAIYYLTLLLAGSGLALLWRLHGSPFGYGLRAVRDQATRAEALGINAERQRGLGFAAGAGLAGAAGGLFAALQGAAMPEFASLTTSVDALLGMLLGGIGHVLGPLVGAAGLVALNDAGPAVFRVTQAAALLLVVLFLPRGILGGWRK